MILFLIGIIYGAGGVLTLILYKDVKEMKSIFEQILSQMQDNDDEETNNFM
ncbi:hypothetical protein [Acidianus bottle-shaped virus 2 strain ABV2]|uniref:Uncharacterized protein n=1 Tax=Acidianus bottle-shaped virus 2 strain ABV2 TaxID=1732173 RepID=A0A0N9NW70_9VIRU|nr:hypothetical protein AVU01_gp22 [Acidianus bottle-shaped virus 2 strain ABV2]ALG96770.1 hypothetical protein [Acidianus bottle-shaped virus 2 strain ABV2]